MKLAIQYEPEALALGDEPRLVGATDGDTPTIQTPVRMLGVDAPELHYQGATEKNPGKYDAAFAGFLSGAGRHLDEALKQYLAPRLQDQASTRHIVAGKAAFEHFQTIVAARLKRSGKNGKPLQDRHLYAMVAREVFDKYGRLLAYLNAAYTKEERAALAPDQRPTFNLQMVQDGHATPLLIYPNVPKPADLELLHDAVVRARRKKLGIWGEPQPPLLAFEFRWIVDTLQGRRAGPDRFCGDFVSGKLYPPAQYHRAHEERRLFFREENLGDAYRMGFRLVT